MLDVRPLLWPAVRRLGAEGIEIPVLVHTIEMRGAPGAAPTGPLAT